MSRDLLYNILAIINNILYSWKYWMGVKGPYDKNNYVKWYIY